MLSAHVDVEKEFGRFVQAVGGEVIADSLPKSPKFLNADYLFRKEAVVAELKRLVEDKSEDMKLKEKIQKKFDGWVQDRTIPPIYGTRRVQSKTLANEMQEAISDDLLKKSQSLPRGTPRSTTTGAMFFSLVNMDQKINFRDALASYAEAKKMIFGAIPDMRLLNKIVSAYIKLRPAPKA
jgi:hypothetical protein